MKIVDKKVVTGIEFDTNELAVIRAMFSGGIVEKSPLWYAKKRLLDKINSIKPDYHNADDAFID